MISNIILECMCLNTEMIYQYFWKDVLALLSDDKKNAICVSTYSHFEILSVLVYVLKESNSWEYAQLCICYFNKNAFLKKHHV